MDLMAYLTFLMRQISFVMNFMSIILGLLTRLTQKNEMLEYMKIMEQKLIDIFSAPTLARKINNANYKGYIRKKLNDEINSGYTPAMSKQFLIFLI